MLQRGSQYADQLFLRSSVTVRGDHPTVPAFRVAANSRPNILADLHVDSSGGPALEFRLWEDSVSEPAIPLRLTPNMIEAPVMKMDEWRIVPTSDNMLFQRMDPATGLYSTLYSLQSMGGSDSATSLALGDWRVRQSGTNLLFEYQSTPGVYETKLMVRSQS
jgi:hypothetical protein